MDSVVVKKVQRWVELDNKIEVKKIKMKEYQDEKKDLEDAIVDYIDSYDKKNLQINTSDGYINFTDNKQTQMLTLKFLRESLNAFFESQPSEVTAGVIMDFVLKNREVKTKLVMRRHITG